MRKKIAIFGSTGSIGKNTLKIIEKNFDDFDVVLLTTNNNVRKVLKQAIKFKVKKVIINNEKKYYKYKNHFKKNNINVYFKINDVKSFFTKKIDFSMCSITGISGLKSTISAIKISKVVGIANKESIICAWNIIRKNLEKFKTRFIPIDSEHFSIWSLLKNEKHGNIEKIYITASGGPFLNKNKKDITNVKPKKAIKHPNWSMGKKISVDSATMMNKVFELIEAQRIFQIDIKKFEILVHRYSYFHSIIKFKNGLIKFLAHDTDMKIPIFNALYDGKNQNYKSKKINFNIINNPDFRVPNLNQFPILNILKLVSNKNTLFETILISANDELVHNYLSGNINYSSINRLLFKIIRFKSFKKYFTKIPKDLYEIIDLSNQVRLKTKKLCIQ